MSRLEDVVEITNAQHPHCATVLLLDTSGSMGGDKINQLNDGLKWFKEDICGAGGDELARKRVDLAIVTFGDGVNVLNDFCSMDEFDPPTLSADGTTPMGAGIERALELLERRKSEYKS